MPRNYVRSVQTSENNIFVANTRVIEEPVQVFNLPGPVYATESGHWAPPKEVLLTSWYASSTSVGTSDLWVVLKIGDFLFEVVGQQRGLLILDSDNRVASGPIEYGDEAYNYPLVTPSEWMAITYSGSTGHNDVTVQLFGKYL